MESNLTKQTQLTKENGSSVTPTPQTTETELKKVLQSHERLITSLADFIKGKMNVHGEIRKITASLNSSFKRLTLTLENSSPGVQCPATTSVAETQTTPMPQRTYSESTVKDYKTQDGTEVVTPKPRETRKVKRQERISPEEVYKAWKKRKNNEPDLQPSGTNSEIRSTLLESEWKTVKKKKPSKHIPKIRPNAVLIRPKEKENYADILKRVKQDASTKNVGQYVDKIRRTTAGDMLLVLSKNNNDRAADIKKTIAGILGSEAVVVSKVPEVTIEIKDLDETTTKQDVIDALVKVNEESINSITLDAIKSLRPSYGGTQTATVKVDAQTASKITGDRAKIKIGWVNCRVRRVEKPIKCYKCWRYGHLSGKCLSIIDRSQLCMKCGRNGHKIATCKNDATCVLCTEDGKKDSAHIAGCGKCPVFRAASQMVHKKR